MNRQHMLLNEYDILISLAVLFILMFISFYIYYCKFDLFFLFEMWKLNFLFEFFCKGCGKNSFFEGFQILFFYFSVAGIWIKIFYNDVFIGLIVNYWESFYLLLSCFDWILFNIVFNQILQGIPKDCSIILSKKVYL